LPQTSRDESHALLALAGTLHAAGRNAEALAALARARVFDAGSPGVHNNLGLVLPALGRASEAEDALRCAIREDPAYAPAHHNLGDLLRESGQLGEARDCYEEALRRTPQLLQSRLNFGNTLLDLGEFAAAAECYREAIARHAEARGAWLNLGIALHKLTRPLEALHAFQQAVAACPDAPPAHSLHYLHGLAMQAASPSRGPSRRRSDWNADGRCQATSRCGPKCPMYDVCLPKVCALNGAAFRIQSRVTLFTKP
jgi:tetratricopeptide (TPR) repeat protein